MPNAANITVNNGAGAAKVFTLLTPAPGYGSPAEWALKEGATVTVWPTFTLAAQKTSGIKGRRATFKVRVPASYTSITTGLPVVSAYLELSGTYTVPDDFPDAQKDEGVAFATNLLSSALVKSALRDALPLT